MRNWNFNLERIIGRIIPELDVKINKFISSRKNRGEKAIRGERERISQERSSPQGLRQRQSSEIYSPHAQARRKVAQRIFHGREQRL